jgi:hypothetical protein
MLFRTSELIEALRIAEIETGTMLELRVSGETFGGIVFTTTDCIRVMHKHGR